MTIDSLLARLQTEITRIARLDPTEADPEVYRRTIEKARALAYLSQVASSIIEKHELEKQLEEIERKLEALPERK
jgi:hypothetical protein